MAGPRSLTTLPSRSALLVPGPCTGEFAGTECWLHACVPTASNLVADSRGTRDVSKENAFEVGGGRSTEQSSHCGGEFRIIRAT
jgi:hypothetical protein